MDKYRNDKYDKGKPVRGVINLSQVIAPTDEKRSNGRMIKASKFHSLRKKIAVPTLTKKGLVELSKEGK